MERQIRIFDEITVPLLCDFQDLLLASGLKAKSVNDEIVAISKVLKYLTHKGLIKSNPYLNLLRIPINNFWWQHGSLEKRWK
jgi:site-specific recombinase XerD